MLNNEQHLKLHQELVSQVDKQHPRVLFIPTASYDSKDYNHIIEDVYEQKLGCEVDYLYLLAESPSFAEIRSKVLWADIIYVPGGNTLKMMRLWRKLKLDQLLKQVWEQGTILAGLSAGSICWYESGHSDSMSFYDPKNWQYIRVKGMGLLKGIHCPHYDSHTLQKPRKQYFHDMLMKTGGHGIAIDDDCAIMFKDDQFKVISAKPSASAYKLYRYKQQIIVSKLPTQQNFTPIQTLYQRQA